MATKTSTRRSNRGKIKQNILLSDIRYSSTCVELNLPVALCCDRCRAIKEAKCGLLKKSSHSTKRFCNTTEQCHCKQPWVSENGDPSKTKARNLMFVRVRNYMNIDCAVEIKTSYAYEKPDKRHKPNIMKSSITTQNPSIENINDCNKTTDLVPCINDCTRMPNLLQSHIEPPSGQQRITTLPTTPILDSARLRLFPC